MIQKEKTSNIYIQLANKYNIPHQVVEVICNHPLNLQIELFQMMKILKQ